MLKTLLLYDLSKNFSTICVMFVIFYHFFDLFSVGNAIRQCWSGHLGISLMSLYIPSFNVIIIKMRISSSSSSCSSRNCSSSCSDSTCSSSCSSVRT